jgi:hypothetical protein
MATPFTPFPKLPRLRRGVVITEKIDGTNASIYIGDDGEFLVGSRNRWITPERDNFGFARWAHEHKDELMELGPGHHFGEWWGHGIQRGYGLEKGERRFSLFNVSRWKEEALPPCCSLVPLLYSGDCFSSNIVDAMIEKLKVHGSYIVPGFMRPEGVCVYLSAARIVFKQLIENDNLPKSLVEASK